MFYDLFLAFYCRWSFLVRLHPTDLGLAKCGNLKNFCSNLAQFLIEFPLLSLLPLAHISPNPCWRKSIFGDLKKIIPKFSKKKTNPNPQKKYISANGIGLGEVWEFEKLLPKFSTIFNRIPNAQPTSPCPQRTEHRDAAGVEWIA